MWPLDKALSVGQSELVYEDPVRAALQELEQSEDERMRPDDEVAPPSDAGSDAVVAAAPPVSAAGPSAGAPIAEVPRRNAAPRPRGSSRVFELLVAFVALAVLGLSLFGLWLLFKS